MEFHVTGWPLAGITIESNKDDGELKPRKKRDANDPLYTVSREEFYNMVSLLFLGLLSGFAKYHDEPYSYFNRVKVSML